MQAPNVQENQNFNAKLMAKAAALILQSKMTSYTRGKITKKEGGFDLVNYAPVRF